MNNSRLRGVRSSISDQGRSNSVSSAPQPRTQSSYEAPESSVQAPGGPQGMHPIYANGGQAGQPAGVPDQASRQQGGQAVNVPPFPSRPGQPACDFYTKTGHCKFGQDCKFNHPAHYAVQLNSAGLPLRPGEPPCSHHEKTGQCKYGPACKFDHPERVG